MEGGEGNGGEGEGQEETGSCFRRKSLMPELVGSSPISWRVTQRVSSTSQASWGFMS